MGVWTWGGEGGQRGAFVRMGRLGDLKSVSWEAVRSCHIGRGFHLGEGGELTGVRSRSESASLADVAASIRSSHRLPIAEAGSAEKAFRPSILSLRAYSFDMLLSCFGRRLFFVMEDFRGLVGLSRFCIGGNVDDRPGGERDMIEGRSSLGLGEWKGEIGSWFMWLCIGGSSTEECIRGRRRASPSDNGSCSTN